MVRTVALFALSASLAAVACSRTTMLSLPLGHYGVGGAGGAGGFGGAGGAGGEGGQGGQGGEGGQEIGWPCETEVAGPVGVDGGGTFAQRQPRLTFSRSDRQQVTVAMEWVMAGSPATTPSELRHTTFQPWGAWPEAALGPSYRASFDGGVSFAVTSAPENRFAMVLSDGGKPTEPDGVLFAPQVSPGSGDVPVSQPIDEGAAALFASLEGNATLVGLGSGVASGSLGVRTLTSFGPIFAIGSRWPLACSRKPAGDAIGSSGGWLVAANGAAGTFGVDVCGAFEDLPSNRVYLSRVESGLGIPTLVATLEAEGDVSRIFLETGAKKTAWLAWSDGSAVRAARLALPTGEVAVAPVVVSTDGLEGGFAATPFLDGLLVVSGEGPLLRFVAPDGTVSTPRELPEVVERRPFDALPAPKGNAGLFSFSKVGSPDRVELARIGCRPN